MDVGNAVKEQTQKSVKCEAGGSNPDNLVDIEFFIGETELVNIKPEVTRKRDSDNGIVKTFTYTFTTDRSQNKKIAQCSLKWNGTFIAMTDASLNITCE